MKEIRFRWSEKKNTANRQKYGVSFDEAKSVFQDPKALIVPDPDHPGEEDRFLILGFQAERNLLIVCQYAEESDTEIRIVSAREATKKESRRYAAGVLGLTAEKTPESTAERPAEPTVERPAEPTVERPPEPEPETIPQSASEPAVTAAPEKAAARKPDAANTKKQITINLNASTVEYFKKEAGETGIPYQTLINLYLTDCAVKKKKLELNWF